MSAKDIIFNAVIDCSEWLEMYPDEQRMDILCHYLAARLKEAKDESEFYKRMYDSIAKHP